MTDFWKEDFPRWTTDPDMAKRYAPIHDMVTELLNSIDPGGYEKILKNLRAEHEPESIGEAHMTVLLADLFWRIQGCAWLDTEILRRGGQPYDTVFLREIQSGGLLTKLAKYESRLVKEQSRCLRILELAAKNRKMAAARIAATNARMAASLAKRKPCTSVIQ
jgi:hypothetical protein